jgi:hypothetical protein
MIQAEHLNKSGRISANRVFKRLRKTAEGDPLMQRCLKTLAQNSFYKFETNEFILDVEKLTSGNESVENCYGKEFKDDNFHSFFRSAYDIYSFWFCFDSGTFFLPSEEVYSKVLSEVVSSQFEPAHMTRILHKPPGLEHQVERPSLPPEILVEVPLIVAATDEAFSEVPDYHSAFSVNYGARCGLPNAVTSGRSDVGLYNNLVSMTKNKVEVDEDYTNRVFTSALFMMSKDAELEKNELQTIQIPDRQDLVDIISTYDSAIGIVPFTNYHVIETDENGCVREHNNKPKSKRALAGSLADMVLEYMTKAEESIGINTKLFPGVSICRSKFKDEIINACEVMDYEELVKYHEKMRIFFIEGAHNIFSSYIVLERLFAYLNRTGWELGTLLNDGGFEEIFKNHSCGTHDCEDPKFEEIYKKYPFLKRRVFVEGDISKFDQSLLYKILSYVGMFFCMFFKMKSNLTLTMLCDVVFRLVYKYLYLVPLSSLYFVKGMMFSGKYETSHGNTAYQNLVWFSYLVVVLERNKAHKEYELLKEIIDFGLFVRSFSADDTALSWPEYCELAFGVSMEDYKIHAGKCGLQFKYIKKKPLYGVVKSVKIGNVWKTDLVQEGITFLKNQMCKIMEDEGNGNFRLLKKRYPYRSWEDLIFRIGNSDRANGTIDGLFAKTISVAYLCMGNRQAYTYCQLFYKNLIDVFGPCVLDKEKLEKLTKGSGALYNLLHHAENMDFPTLQSLRERHDRHHVKKSKVVLGVISKDRSRKRMMARFIDEYRGDPDL